MWSYPCMTRYLRRQLNSLPHWERNCRFFFFFLHHTLDNHEAKINEVRNAGLGNQVVLHFRLWLWTLIGDPSPRLTACQSQWAQSTHWWLRMHRLLILFSPPAEAVCRGVATTILNSFLEARSESWVLGEDQCYRPSQGMLLSSLQRYYLSPDTPHTPKLAMWFIHSLLTLDPPVLPLTL